MHKTLSPCLKGGVEQGDFAVLFFGSVDHAGRRERLLQMAEAVMESGENCEFLKDVLHL